MAQSGGGASILLICDFNAHGGTQTHVLELLAGLRKSRFRPALAALSLHPDLKRRLALIGAEVNDLALRGAARPATWKTVLGLARRVRRNPPDLLHGFLYQGNALTALVSHLTGVPCLTSVRNLDLWKRRRHRAVSRWAHRRAARVVFNSSAVRDWTAAREGISRERTLVIPNGVADPLAGMAHARPAPIARRAPVVACVASLRPKKGHVDLLDAFVRVRRAVPGATLRLVGEGPLRGALEAAVRERALEGAVTFDGYRPDAVDILAQSDLFVLPSLEEGMPNALLEAMGVGLPAVATAVGGTPEALEDGLTGLLAPSHDPAQLADRLIALLQDAARRDAMGRAARERFVERFTTGGMIASYEALYAEVIGRRGGTPRSVAGAAG